MSFYHIHKDININNLNAKKNRKRNERHNK